MTAALEGGEWSAARPGRNLTPGKTRYPLYRRLVGPPGLVWTSGKSRPHRDSIPNRQPVVSRYIKIKENIYLHSDCVQQIRVISEI